MAVAAAALSLTACNLDQEPEGSTITENQFQAMDNATEGAVLGIYSKLYAYGGEHDAFGLRSMDMYGDLLCGDMAMKNQNYGWFSTDEQGQTSTRRGYFWSFYYNIIRACNKGLNAIAAQGIPELDADKSALSDDQYTSGYYYAELLTIRGWAYASLMRYFVKAPQNCKDSDVAIPIYTEEDTKDDATLGAPRATVADVYLRIEEDLRTAIDYYDAFNEIERNSKLEVNKDVALMSLAYMYLNAANEDNPGAYANALKYAEELINSTSATLLPLNEVLTTGFNNVDHNNWIWGENVTVENYTGLASFFGQCDIYSYSYASAGDVKGIDENLYKSIVEDHPWDVRAGWWNNYFNSGKPGASATQWAPDGKFYSATSKTLQGDRDWLSDNIFMRLEQAYLIAAEAAFRSGDKDKALTYLCAITDQRVKEGAESTYREWLASLETQLPGQKIHPLLEAIRYNWRVEMWGEGFGLQTFRRFGLPVSIGENHLRSHSTDLDPNRELVFSFDIPSSEYTYNPAIRDVEVAEVSSFKHAPRH